MANTFKFGNGEWAVGKETALAYNDENNNFKPLPFSFDRASTATVVNKNGLIDTVGVDEPRIDFLNNTKGHLLLEPSRSNLITDYTGAGFSAFNGASITANDSTSPDGSTNATLITTTGGANELIQQAGISISSGQSYTVSGYFKLKSGTLSDPDNAFKGLDGLNGGGITGSTFNSTLTSEWQRLSFTVTSSTTSGRVQIKCEDAAEILVWGLQVELGSYATSIIPTSGSAVTRNNEDISLTFPDNASFNSSNGFSLYGELLTNGGNGASPIAISFNTNVLGYFGFGHNSLTWRARVNDGTDNELHTSSASILSVGKLALSFDASGFSMYANGTSFASGNTDLGANTSVDNITFRNNTEEFGSLQIRELKLYNDRLSDSELQALTTI